MKLKLYLMSGVFVFTGQAFAFSGLWCSAFKAEDQSCQLIRTIELVNSTEARIRQISLGTDQGAFLKTAIDISARIEGNSLCYPATRTAIEQVSMFWSADAAPVLRAEDQALPRERVEASLKRSGLARVVEGPVVCWSPAEPGFTFFPSPDGLLLRAP